MTAENITEKDNIYSLFKELANFKAKFIQRKLYVKKRLNFLDKEIEKLELFLGCSDTVEALDKLALKLKKLCDERDALLAEKKLFKNIDSENAFTYEVLGNFIKKFNNCLEFYKIQEPSQEEIDFWLKEDVIEG